MPLYMYGSAQPRRFDKGEQEQSDTAREARNLAFAMEA